jgi:Tfp pilus assembly protein PilE
MNYPHRQRGLTAISMVVVILVVLFFALIAIRLFPVYVENYKVSSHLKRLAESSEIKTMNDKEILQTLFKRLQLDDVENVKAENVFIERDTKGKGSIVLAVEYEVRKPVMGNVDLVVSFVEEAEGGG